VNLADTGGSGGGCIGVGCIGTQFKSFTLPAPRHCKIERHHGSVKPPAC
jgi:hypothetical protein